MKLAFSQHAARTGDLVMEIMGADAMLWDDYALDHSRWQNYFLSQYAVRIGGGGPTKCSAISSPNKC
jgi:hypothetical protein